MQQETAAPVGFPACTHTIIMQRVTDLVAFKSLALYCSDLVPICGCSTLVGWLLGHHSFPMPCSNTISPKHEEVWSSVSFQCMDSGAAYLCAAGHCVDCKRYFSSEGGLKQPKKKEIQSSVRCPKPLWRSS